TNKKPTAPNNKQMQTIRATSNNTRIKIPFCKTRCENRSCLCRCFTYMMYEKNKNQFYSSSVTAKCSSTSNSISPLSSIPSIFTSISPDVSLSKSSKTVSSCSSP